MPLPAAGPCPWCLGKGLYPYESIARLGIYEEPLRGLIHQMKYERRWTLAETLAERLAEHPGAREILEDVECIVPVPLHFRRHFSRGYNQSEVMAGKLAQGRRPKVCRAAARLRDTESQTQLHSLKARHENVRGAFVLKDAEAVRGKRVLVVDDVMTTGSTLRAVGRALREARPAALYAMVLAVADPKGRDFKTV